MIGVKVDQMLLNNFIRDLKKMGKIIGSQGINEYRARQFRKFTIGEVMGGNLNLKKLSNATIKIAGNHNPLYSTGGLMSNMEVRKAGKNAADVGYFEKGAKTVPGTNITYTKLALLQHTGYKIKITGEKGKRVMAWLRAQGVFDGNPSGTGLDKGEGYLIVKARPFMLKSLNKYEAKGLDMKAVDDFLKNLSNAPDGGK